VFDTPQWNSTVAACTGCHVVGYHSAYIESGSHAEHVQGYYYAQGSTASPRNCTVCHKWNPAASRTSCGQQCHDGDEKTYHVNGRVDVLFDSFAGTGALYNGTPAPGDGFASCSNTYCHSNGTSVATGSITANTTANWGSGPLACTACHANGPDYANGSPKANSHQLAAHAAATCNICHSSTTADGTTIASGVTHVNSAYDVNAGGGASFAYTYAPTGGTCATVSCHAGGATRTWGGP
jgi:predicted CxxxxCH...CXXCH cytochrome family protein